MNKKELRYFIRTEKARFTPEQLRDMSRPIIKALLSHPLYRKAKTLLLYESLPDEVCTHELIEEARKTKDVYIAPVTGEFIELPGIDLAIVPAMAYDKEGNRLGRGGGYYDRLLPQLHCPSIGLCFPFQLVDSIPVEPHDVKVDEVLAAQVQRATEYFMQGYGCCQSVVAAFADHYGLDETMALKIAAGFGGGVGRMRMMCGTVSALVILAGLEQGQTEGSDREGKAACYKLVQQLVGEFKEQNGSIVCAELLRMNGCKAATDTNIPDERTAEYYKRRPCVRKVECAARIFQQYLEKTKTQNS